MNKSEPESTEAHEAERPASSGPNLTLIYGFMLIAFLIAMGVAAMIVWPFYRHR